MTLSLDALVERLGETLQLTWAGNSAGRDVYISDMADSEQSAPLAAYLNTIHPSQIQVVGAAELEFLGNTPHENLAHILEALKESGTVAWIVSDGLTLESRTQTLLKQAQIAVLHSSLEGHALLYRMRYALGEWLAEQVTLHGVFMQIFGIGVLVTGKSGIGKSELALELISRNHRMIADDAPLFSRVAPDVVNGSCPELLQDFLEVRGLGILNIRRMFGDNAIQPTNKLELIIHLRSVDEGQLAAEGRLAGLRDKQLVAEVPVDRITLPVVVGHNLAVLVETACRDHSLRMRGYAADEAFSARQQRVINEQHD